MYLCSVQIHIFLMSIIMWGLFNQESFTRGNEDSRPRDSLLWDVDVRKARERKNRTPVRDSEQSFRCALKRVRLQRGAQQRDQAKMGRDEKQGRRDCTRQPLIISPGPHLQQLC